VDQRERPTYTITGYTAVIVTASTRVTSASDTPRDGTRRVLDREPARASPRGCQRRVPGCSLGEHGMHRTTDFELLTMWRSGQVPAGNELFARHVRSVLRFFRNKAGDAAEDLAQRTFLALVEAKDDFRGDASFRTYLFAVARSQLLMHFRGRAIDNARFDPQTWSAIDLGVAMAHVVAHEQAQRVVLAALQRLPIDSQVTFELFYWEDLAIADIARVCEVAEGTIKARLSRGRELLREHIAAIAEHELLLRSASDDVERWLRTLAPIVVAKGDEAAGA
jgi:RNA polymerase sigma-70 factor (ECF subfamily)